MSRKELVEDRREEINEIASQHGATSVKLFGSVARGEETENSDIDFLVTMDADATLLDQAAIIRELSECLEAEVDVVTPGSLDPAIRERVLNEAVDL